MQTLEEEKESERNYIQLTPKRGGLGNWPSPSCRNSMYNFWFPKNLSFSSIFSGDWFQDPSQRILKSPVENGVGRSIHSWTPNRGLKTVQVFTEKNPHIKWTHAVRTRIVQASPGVEISVNLPTSSALCCNSISTVAVEKLQRIQKSKQLERWETNARKMSDHHNLPEKVSLS